MKYYRFAFLLILFSCTDKYDPLDYSFINSSQHNLTLLLFNMSQSNKILTIPRDSVSPILYSDFAPYNGPFVNIDSIVIIFEDNKKLTYKPLISNDDCITIPRNPYCAFSHYKCNNNNCSYEIDIVEYSKAE